MRHSRFAAVLLTSLAFLGLTVAQDGPETVLRGTKQFRKSVLASGLAAPWELTWGPDNMLWVTERTGKRITRIDPGSGARTVAIAIAEVSAPGGQDGLLGMALDPQLLKGAGHDYVYAAYTYVDPNRAVAAISAERSPYRFLYSKIVRLTYNRASQTLSDPVDLIKGLPAGNDHVSGRLKIGPDGKLYFTIGDRGNNQLGNFCLPVESQRLPTQQELENKDYVAYVGKSLRLNPDGSVPRDNPRLNGVVSHVYTYGHRNAQGIDFAPDGTLYASEHGPKSDDEVNILKAGSNYGWPNVAGMKDNKAYEYARWSEAGTPCGQLRFSDLAIHPSVPREPESAFTKPFVEPIATMFTVPTGYNFSDPACKGVDFICWPTTGASSIEYYESKNHGVGGGIPGWDKVLFVTTLKRASLYVLPLAANGQSAAGRFSRYFQSDNRFRDTAVSPDGRTIYIATDTGGMAEAVAGGTTRTMQNPGAILAFTYEGEVGTPTLDAKPAITSAPSAQPAPVRVVGTVPLRFTAEQSAAGKVAYDSNCAVCHGSTMTNGTFAPPLAGESFKSTWSGKTAGALYDRAAAMPPAAPGSLPSATYANILAYVLEVNGIKAGSARLPERGPEMEKMEIK